MNEQATATPGRRFLAHHFPDHGRQFDAGKLGMWVFLLTEVLFFGGLFCAYAVFRTYHSEAFAAGAAALDSSLGATNTGVLLLSSLTMAWAVRAAQLGNRRVLVLTLGLTLACAVGFMVIKGIEYQHKFHDGLLPGRFWAPSAAQLPADARLFFGIYFGMTGLHGLHVLIGMGVIAWLIRRSLRGDFTPEYHGPVEFVGLYWHLVDLVWIYLFPLLYLI